MPQIAFILLVLVGTNWLARKMIYESGSAGIEEHIVKITHKVQSDVYISIGNRH
jgi:hypothetical protein